MLQILVSTAVALLIFVSMTTMNVNARNDIHLLKKRILLDTATEESYIEVEKSIRAYGSVASFWANRPNTEPNARLRSMVTLRFVRGDVTQADMRPRTNLRNSSFTVNGKTYTVNRSFHPMSFSGNSSSPDYIRVDALVFEGTQQVLSKSKFFVD